MGNDFRSLPTSVLIAKWERLRDDIKESSPGGCSSRDLEVLWELRREIDRRDDVPKPSVDINFASDYISD
jgi:hypothetical protein